MNAVANDYSQGTLAGRGFETEFNGTRVHVIAWDNGDVERLRAIPQFTDHLVITTPALLVPGLETLMDDVKTPESLPWNGDQSSNNVAMGSDCSPLEPGEPVVPEPTTTVADISEPPIPLAPKEIPPSPAIPVAAETTAQVEAPLVEEAVPAWTPTPGATEAETIRSCLTYFGAAVPSKIIIEALATVGITVTASQVFAARKAIGK